MAESKRSNYARVGIFVLLGLIVSAVLVFVIGSARHMFAHKVQLHATFADAEGLRAGSIVRMGGVDVGTVTRVYFSPQTRDNRLHVDFEVVQDAVGRIRFTPQPPDPTRAGPCATSHQEHQQHPDWRLCCSTEMPCSTATIAGKGLLGDMLLDITIGDPEHPAAHAGEAVPSGTGGGIAGALASAQEIAGQIRTVTERIEIATRPLGNERLANELIAMATDLHTITNQVATGNGTVGRLLRDPQMADRVNATLGSVQGAARDIQNTTGQVSAMARDARTGNGLIHALIYDPSGARAIGQLGNAADELAAITHDVRTGNGGLHNIIYGNESGQLIANLTQASAGIRDIVRDVQRGRGTIGALLVDPSLYEDLKSLVGNVQRNEILRAMVRYSIRASERDAQSTPVARPADSAPANSEGGGGSSGSSGSTGAAGNGSGGGTGGNASSGSGRTGGSGGGPASGGTTAP